jgi:hypothetical protein
MRLFILALQDLPIPKDPQYSWDSIQDPINMVKYKYGKTGAFLMKTTVEIPDELYRQAKIKAAREGVTLRELVERGLRLSLQTSPGPPQRVDFPLIRSAASKPALTDELVNAALAEIDEGEAQNYGDSVRR